MGPWAHPRSRGENCTYAINASTDAGSSPLTRGKRPHVSGHRRQGRLIPAHAGKTCDSGGVCDAHAAHPRSRGENRQGLVQSLKVRGLIPAHAGKTCQAARSQCSCSAHPRSRGENASRDAHSSEPTGSSPLTRGKRRPPWPGRYGQAAHPRSRGENPPPVRIGVAAPGSSPLTRGKRRVWASTVAISRLIPAHAGKT